MTPTTVVSDAYLRKVRQGLASLPVSEREDIIAGLRSHLSERQHQGSDDPLAGFDSPERFAAEFVAEYALRGALAQGTSWALGRALLVAGRDSALGLLVLLPLLVLQLSAAVLLLAAGLKPFLPGNVGFWVGDGNFSMGIRSGSAGLHEVLGWWSILVFASSGGLLFWLLFALGVLAMSFGLAWLTRESGSVWPAALAHGANNTLGAGFLIQARGWSADTGAELVALGVVGAVFVWLSLRRGPGRGQREVEPVSVFDDQGLRPGELSPTELR